MKLSEQIKPISYLKAHAPEVIGNITETGQPVIITVNGEAKAVLQDIVSYEETQETLAMLKVLALSMKDVAEGRVSPAKEAMTRIRARVKGD